MEEQPATSTPAEEKESANWWGVVLWPMAILLLYVLSVGPVLMMHTGKLRPFDHHWVQVFYAPVGWAYENTPLHKPLGIYFHLWAPQKFDEHGDY